MVQDTGKTLRADAYKPVNQPVPVKIEEDSAGRPLAVLLKRRLPVMSLEDRWRLDDEWWRAAPLSRLYYNVLLADGRRMVLYKDLIRGDWYEQEY